MEGLPKDIYIKKVRQDESCLTEGILGLVRIGWNVSRFPASIVWGGCLCAIMVSRMGMTRACECQENG